MGRQPSLTARISLMFMLVVAIVLTAAGLIFTHLSHKHFQMMDQMALEEKLHAAENTLKTLSSVADIGLLHPQLKALLSAHEELVAVIQDHAGNELFASSSQRTIPAQFSSEKAGQIWEWHDQEHMFRGLTDHVTLPEEPPLTIMVALDVTMHMTFFESLQKWFWIGLVCSALISAALGWVVVRKGLRPIGQVARVAASVSAKSLKARIPLAPVPYELQELVSSFNAMLDRLDDSFVRLSNFSADIAHELRTPVANLTTHTEVILSRKRDIEDYEENLYSNLDDLKRMARMIDDMLFLAKADNGLIIPAHQNVDLRETAEKLAEYYQLLADEKDIKLVVEGYGSIKGDILMIHRAISNLLSNALRYTPERETIKVEIREDSAYVVLTVKNPGSAIEPEHLDKLFDRFYRADPARREGSPHNAGLGLAITRSIVEAHHGRAGCTSTGGINQFFFEFPKAVECTYSKTHLAQ
ncbi:heavy metal sensor histidine kinase [Pseudomonas luteola]|uniref:heavy metal sensor histidine kinase n=1 Tax=Pseudomonas TaxID=286 RepID=UPI001EF453AB|nr:MULTISPECIES: heavy metal sensor histidine kinase [Pseudomonas]MCG7373951.1 heavy metal sensor histidine kinase [Pseudomonas luteola]